MTVVNCHKKVVNFSMRCLHGAIVAAISRATDNRDDRTV